MALIVMEPKEAIQRAANNRSIVTTLRQKVLQPGLDYGIIPGSTKPSLLKPGAEKLLKTFNYGIRFEQLDAIQDWDKNLFHYRYKATVYDLVSGVAIAEGIGSCNSKEDKYRWRQPNLKCPDCGAEAVIKSKQDPGYYCFNKKGGCGAKFAGTDERITGQSLKRVENPDVASQINTIDKMAQKRAFIAPVLIATGASEFFTQDIEDMWVIEGEFLPVNTEETDILARSLGLGDTESMMNKLEILSLGKNPLDIITTVYVDKGYRLPVYSVTKIQGSKSLGLKLQTPLGVVFATEIPEQFTNLELDETTDILNQEIRITRDQGRLFLAEWL